jgi:hypothetical protein
MYSNKFKDRDFLYEQFIVLKKTPHAIGKMCGVSQRLIIIWLDSFGFLEKF